MHNKPIDLLAGAKYNFYAAFAEMFYSFLPSDATQSAFMRLHVVCLSVRLSVTFRYRDHIGWNSSKIISRPNSLKGVNATCCSNDIYCRRE